jgi:hypothetical protein
VEEGDPESSALDALEELLGDDLVGVDVGSRQGGDATSMAAKRFRSYLIMYFNYYS